MKTTKQNSNLTPLSLSLPRAVANRRAAWTLPEVMIATAVAAVGFAGLFQGLRQGFVFTQESRENLRATQILEEKMETIRLYTWDQLNTSGYIPTTFTNYYYPDGVTNGNEGIAYVGTEAISPAPLAGSYSNDLRQVVVSVTWNSGSISHQQQMTTFVSHYGMQNYIYSAK